MKDRKEAFRFIVLVVGFIALAMLAQIQEPTTSTESSQNTRASTTVVSIKAK